MPHAAPHDVFCFGRSVIPETEALASLAAQGLPAGFNVQLLPWGTFRAVDGRPGKGRHWTLDADAAAQIVADFEARKNDLVVDFEHQTLNAAMNGQPAPAAGWIKALFALPGRGLFARVEWTARAAQMIAEKAYRYISPVFAAEKETLVVRRLLHAALVNDPGLDGMAEVALARLVGPASAAPESPSQPNGVDMELLTSLRVALGLAAEATPESALTAVSALKTDLAAARAEIEALKGNAFDPAKHVPIETHKAVADELSAMKAAQHEAAVVAEVEAALAARKLAPAQKEWALALGRKDLDALRAFVKDAPEVAPGHSQSGGKPPVADKKALDDPAALAALAAKYMAEQAALGRVISSADAVNHVSKKG